MIYIVYKTTCLSNEKIYIGAHAADDMDDLYLGSGVALQRAIRLYGRDSFKREILAIFDNSDDMYAYEAEMVDEEFVKSRSNYNLKTGGVGGVKLSLESRQLISKKKLGTKLSANTKKKMSLAKIGRKVPENIRKARIGKKVHSAEWRAALSKHHSGEGNPMFGKTNPNGIQKKSKPCKIYVDGSCLTFPSATVASSELGIDRGMINYSIKHNKQVNSRGKSFLATRIR